MDRFQIWTLGLQPNVSHSDRWDLQYNILSMTYDILTEAVKFELDQLAQASQISLGRVLQATNTSNNIKQPFYLNLLPQNPPPTPQPPPPSPLTTSDRHEPPLLVVRPSHRE